MMVAPREGGGLVAAVVEGGLRRRCVFAREVILLWWAMASARRVKILKSQLYGVLTYSIE